MERSRSGSNNNGRGKLDEIFKDYRARRTAIIKALTTDVQEFYQQCDPEKENLCLYGHPNETWEVNIPVEEVPPELPEPALGINFARDGMKESDWLSLVAVHSDAWLMAIAVYYGARFGLDKNDRMRLFNMINELPTIFEVVSGSAKKQTKERSGTGDSSSKSKSGSAKSGNVQAVSLRLSNQIKKDEEEEEEEEEEEDSDRCGKCGELYADDGEFWIGCDVCNIWYHGKCVRITKEKADNIKKYVCPECTHKRPRV